jgi:hypothetical protein
MAYTFSAYGFHMCVCVRASQNGITVMLSRNMQQYHMAVSIDCNAMSVLCYKDRSAEYRGLMRLHHIRGYLGTRILVLTTVPCILSEKMTTHLHLVPRSRTVELHLHSLVCLYGIALNQLSTGFFFYFFYCFEKSF